MKGQLNLNQLKLIGLLPFTEEEVEKYDSKLIGVYYHDVEKEAVRNLVLTDRKRLDGRETAQIRPIWC